MEETPKGQHPKPPKQRNIFEWAKAASGLVAILVVVIGWTFTVGGKDATLKHVTDQFKEHCEDQKVQTRAQADSLDMFSEYLKGVYADQKVTQAKLDAIQNQLERLEKSMEKPAWMRGGTQ